MDDILTSEEAHKIAAEASDRSLSVWREYRAALDALEAHWRPLVNEAKRASKTAAQNLSKAIAAETRDHELHGRKVFLMEPEIARWTGKKIGEKRIDGVIDTYRPGADLGRGYSKAQVRKAGDPFVRLLLKNGKPGTYTRDYTGYYGEPLWQFSDQQA